MGENLRGDTTGAAPRWEYKEVTIPLNLVERLTDKKIRPEANRLITQELEEQRSEGWEPDEPSDLSSLRSGNRVQFRFRWFLGPIYVSVKIRLRRAAEGDVPT
jgi:hypothetical protein